MRMLLFFILILCIPITASGSVVILNGLTHIHHTSAGNIIEGQIILLNSGESNERVTFQLNDIHFPCGNERKFTFSETHPRSSKNWFESNITDKLLLPNERFVYKYRILVPNKDTVYGSYWSAIMVEVEKPIKEEKIEENFNVESKIRYAVGIIANVEKVEELQLEFDYIDFLSGIDNNSSLEVRLQNISDFLENIHLQLEIYDETGKKVFQENSIRKRIFPGSCTKFEINVTDLPSGSYECMLLAESRNEYVGANINLIKK
jgi:hypothetical protein